MTQPLLSRRQALLTLLKERRLDYVPATTYGVDRYSHPWMGNDPSFQRILEYTDEHEHIFVLHLSYYASFGFTDVLGLADPGAAEQRTFRKGDATHFEFTLHTPQGDLGANYTENDGVHTLWRHDPLIKGDEDVDRFLSAPFAPTTPGVAAFEETRRALGERGLMEVELPDPLCLVVENMSYEDFMVRTLLAPAKIDALLDRMTELLCSWLEPLLRAGFGPVFRIFGPEYAAPPMMSSEFFKKAVVGYDRPVVDLIHRYGGLVRYHCHGPIAGILDDMLALGVDMTDPCEAPPSGDITLRQLADRMGRNLVLMGNIQLDDLERAEPDKIDRLVAEAVEAVGGRAPFILCPTAFPFSSPLPSVTERNLIQFLTSAEKYGLLSAKSSRTTETEDYHVA
jgi:Uroporphyrinogen decarboxylase (URO-D)